MARILALYTGGTIGMEATPAGLAPSPGLLPQLMERLAEPGRTVEVVEYPDLIDSSAITVAHWNRLIDDLAEAWPRYDGFVVIHGTDTLAYTASVLAFALAGLDKPVVVTGAQLPLGEARSDGWANLSDALLAASQPDLAEVVVAFDRQLLRGCRARKLDAESFAGFSSPNAPPLAEFGITPRWYRSRWRQPGKGLRPTRLSSDRVAAFFLTPGISSQLIGHTLGQTPLDGAVLMSYGNGNAPADAALLEGVRRATARGTLVVNLTQVVRGAAQVGAYAISQPLAAAGALCGRDMTPEAAVAKLLLLASQPLTPQARREAFEEDWAGEVSAAA